MGVRRWNSRFMVQMNYSPACPIGLGLAFVVMPFLSQDVQRRPRWRDNSASATNQVSAVLPRQARVNAAF
jgi:hypothetical protein